MLAAGLLSAVFLSGCSQPGISKTADAAVAPAPPAKTINRTIPVPSSGTPRGQGTPEPAAAPAPGLNDDDIARLKSRGLKNPEADLKASLQKQSALIPHKGVAGGTMGFYDPNAIRILEPGKVEAEFEDGHIAGVATLKYTVASGGKIQWKLLSSRLDD